MVKQQNDATSLHEPSLDGFAVLERVFCQVSQAPRNRQEELLEELCTDPNIREQVKVLLQADSSENQLLDNSIFPAPVELSAGARVGDYKLLEEIGRGGMGIVYMAEQLEPVRRLVALKVVKPGVDTRQVVARFAAEQQALSMMNHPNIAKVLDAGQTETGRPFFVMELVKGRPITRYCTDNQLLPKQRLELFRSACHAIQHAHQKGVIHRDIKPSNVLVAEYDGVPVVKVIDFGVAKAIAQPLTELTLFTGFGQVIGTLEYMSPEQSRFNQLDIDTRSDIYALGVLLYELLTGSTPFDRQRLQSVAWEEMLRIIREEEPPKPSTRLSTSAKNATDSETVSSDAARTSRWVRGELDWIVMKALEKDRERRYESPQAMASDISRFLNGAPVTACPPTWFYRFCKFAQRNRAVLTTSAVVLASLVLGLVGTTWQAFRASRAEAEAVAKQELAEKQRLRAVASEQKAIVSQRKAVASERKAVAKAKRASAVSKYLRNDLLGLHGGTTLMNTEVRYEPDMKLVTLLQRAKDRLDDRFFDQPEGKLEIQMMLVASFSSVQKYETASEILRSIIETLVNSKGSDHESVIEANRILATLELQQRNWDKARDLFDKLLQMQRRVHGRFYKKSWKTLHNLAVSHNLLGDYEEAKRFFEDYYDICLQTEGPQSQSAIRNRASIASVLGKLGEFEKAESLFKQSLESCKNDTSGELQRDRILNGLGELYVTQSRFAEAQLCFAEALEIRVNRMAPDSEHIFNVKLNLANAYLGLGKLENAAELRGEVLDFFDEYPTTAFTNTIEQLEQHSTMLIESNDYITAEELLRKTTDLAKKCQANLLVRGSVHSLLGKTLAVQGKIDLAEEHLLRAWQELSEVSPAQRDRVEPKLVVTAKHLVELYEQQNNEVKALAWRNRVLEATKK